ncbi:MAG: ferritin [Candidatus Latescibacteria bacterium]|nr:ferritin [Candidatus Latescibacterota bacterium]
MLGKKMEKMMNKQVNREFYAAYLYLSMAAYFDTLNLSGFAQWMRTQTQEEVVHAMKIFDYIQERGGKVILEAIEKPSAKLSSPLAAFEAAYEHEQKVTGWINELVDAAREEKDHASVIFLQWYVTEQVEEEQSVDAIVNHLKMVGDSPHALLMIDRELGKRAFNAPASGSQV